MSMEQKGFAYVSRSRVLTHLRWVSLKFAIVAALLAGGSVFIWWRLRDLLLEMPIAMFFLVAVLVLGLVALAWSLFLAGRPLSHPTLVRLERRSPWARERAIGVFEDPGLVIAHGPLGITREVAVHLHPWGLQARLMDDLAWIHPTTEEIRYDGALYKTYLMLTMRFRRDSSIEIVVKPAELNELIEMLAQSWPAVVVGWSDRLETRWRKTRSTFGLTG